MPFLVGTFGPAVMPQFGSGDAAVHLPIGNVRLPQSLAPLSGMTTKATKLLKKQIVDIGVPEVPDFLDKIVAAGRSP